MFRWQKGKTMNLVTFALSRKTGLKFWSYGSGRMSGCVRGWVLQVTNMGVLRGGSGRVTGVEGVGCRGGLSARPQTPGHPLGEYNCNIKMVQLYCDKDKQDFDTRSERDESYDRDCKKSWTLTDKVYQWRKQPNWQNTVTHESVNHWLKCVWWSETCN